MIIKMMRSKISILNDQSIKYTNRKSKIKQQSQQVSIIQLLLYWNWHKLGEYILKPLEEEKKEAKKNPDYRNIVSLNKFISYRNESKYFEKFNIVIFFLLDIYT